MFERRSLKHKNRLKVSAVGAGVMYSAAFVKTRAAVFSSSQLSGGFCGDL